MSDKHSYKNGVHTAPAAKNNQFLVVPKKGSKVWSERSRTEQSCPDDNSSLSSFWESSSEDCSGRKDKLRTCKKNGQYIYDSSIIYTVDDTFIPGEDLMIEMDAKRDTMEYRKRAYDWFKDAFDLTLPPAAQHGDLIFGGKALMQVWKANPKYRMSVLGVDIQDHPTWRGKYPLCNAFFKDDGYMIIVQQEGLIVRGKFGDSVDPVNGYEVPVGSFILYGEYNLWTENSHGKEKFQTAIQYQSDCPVTPSPHPPYAIAVNCTVNHPDFGHGATVGRSEFTAEKIHSQYRMNFPRYRADNKGTQKKAYVLPDYH